MQGTAAVLRRLDAISNAITNGVPKAMSDHLQQQANNAQTGYNNFSLYDGANDVIVQMMNDKNEWSIVASGEALLFIEFGTGITYRHDNPIEHPANAPASWSISHEEFLTNPQKLKLFRGYWPIPGETFGEGGYLTNGNPSANIFYELGKNIKFNTTPVVSAEIKKAFQ